MPERNGRKIIVGLKLIPVDPNKIRYVPIFEKGEMVEEGPIFVYDLERKSSESQCINQSTVPRLIDVA